MRYLIALVRWFYFTRHDEFLERKYDRLKLR